MSLAGIADELTDNSIKVNAMQAVVRTIELRRNENRDVANRSGKNVTAQDDDKIDVFLAAGRLGRTVMSIDDDATWIHDRSDDDTARCWCEKHDPHYVECDHDPRSFNSKHWSANVCVNPRTGTYVAILNV